MNFVTVKIDEPFTCRHGVETHVKYEGLVPEGGEDYLSVFHKFFCKNEGHDELNN